MSSLIPDHYICPISLELMRDPVVCSDGITYERSHIARWLEENNTSPKTNMELESKTLIPNFAIKAGIDRLKQGKSSEFKRSCEVGRTETSPCAAESFQILVKTLTNHKIQVTVQRSDKVVDIMERLAETQGVKVSQQRLIHRGKLLDRERLATDYGIEHNSTLHLLLRFVGG